MSNESDDRNLALLLDALTSELPDAALLARYARDPASLTPENRAEVESAAQTSPWVTDELRSLRNFDFEALARIKKEVKEEARATLWTRLREWLSPQTGFWIVGVATAALALAILRPWQDSGPAPSRGAGAQIARAPEPMREPAAAPPIALSTPEASPVPVGGEMFLQMRELERKSPPTPPPAREVVSAPHPTPPPPPTSETVKEPTQVAKPSGEPEPATESEPILVAMAMPEYERPAEAAARHRPTALRGGEPASSRVALHALAPAHVARTSRSQPELLWHLDALPAGGTFGFVIETTDRTDPSPTLIDTEIPFPAHPGRQRIRLSKLGVELPEGRELQWAVTYQVDREAPALSYSIAWIQRVPLPADLSGRLENAQPADVPALYARAGLWYEALSSVVDLAERHPGNAKIEEAYRSLLEQANLAELSK